MTTNKKQFNKLVSLTSAFIFSMHFLYAQPLIWSNGFNVADGITSTACAQTTVNTWTQTTCIPTGWRTGRIQTSGANIGRRASATIQWDIIAGSTDNAGLDFEPGTTEPAGLMTQGASLTGGVAYSLDFFYRVPGSSGGGSWRVEAGITTSNAQQALPALTQIVSTGNTNTTWNSACFSFTPPTTGTYYIYFRVRNTNAAATQRIIFDDMRLYQNPTCVTVLPVSLASFNANCTDDGVQVTWSTAIEHNSQKFIIEKSRDTENWRTISEVQGAGNSNSLIQYEINDRTVANGVSYYRLRQVDFDGKEEVYNIVSVDCSNMKSFMTVYPNPAQNAVTVLIEAEYKIEEASLCVIDLNGRIVNQRIVDLLPGTNTVLINDLELQNGSYFVKVMSEVENDFTPVKLIVQK